MKGGGVSQKRFLFFLRWLKYWYVCGLVEQSNRDQPTKQPLKKQKHKIDATGERGALLG